MTENNNLTSSAHLQSKNYLKPTIKIIVVRQSLMEDKSDTGQGGLSNSREYRSDWSDD